LSPRRIWTRLQCVSSRLRGASICLRTKGPETGCRYASMALAQKVQTKSAFQTSLPSPSRFGFPLSPTGRSISARSLYTRTNQRVRYKADGANMPRWTLSCPACRSHFFHSEIPRRSWTLPYDPLWLRKPEFPDGGESLTCPTCQKTSVFQRFELMYKPG
jgi:hypothetical protein